MGWRFVEVERRASAALRGEIVRFLSFCLGFFKSDKISSRDMVE
jgi:hypothetical protein